MVPDSFQTTFTFRAVRGIKVEYMKKMIKYFMTLNGAESGLK